MRSSPKKRFLLAGFALLGLSLAACSSAPVEETQDVEEREDALGVDSASAKEIADAVAAHSAACVDLTGSTLLHKCSSRGNVRPRIRIEVHALARTDHYSATGAVVVRA